MSDIQITVADTKPPAEGKKQGKVIDTTGKTWQVWADKLHLYQPGGTHLVQKFKTFEFQGKTYYTIEQATAVGGAAPAQASAVQAYVPPPTPFTSTSEVTRRMDIFICGIMNNTASNEKLLDYPENELVEKIQMLKRVWKRSFLSGDTSITSGAPARDNSDMNDDIPF